MWIWIPNKFAKFQAKRLNRSKNIPKSFRGLLFKKKHSVGHNPPSLLPYVGGLGSGVRVSASLRKNPHGHAYETHDLGGGLSGVYLVPRDSCFTTTTVRQHKLRCLRQRSAQVIPFTMVVIAAKSIRNINRGRCDAALQPCWHSLPTCKTTHDGRNFSD